MTLCCDVLHALLGRTVVRPPLVLRWEGWTMYYRCTSSDPSPSPPHHVVIIVAAVRHKKLHSTQQKQALLPASHWRCCSGPGVAAPSTKGEGGSGVGLVSGRDQTKSHTQSERVTQRETERQRGRQEGVLCGAGGDRGEGGMRWKRKEGGWLRP